jgi:hypothetical protein
VVTVILFDAAGNQLQEGGDEVIVVATSGELGPALDNENGTYSAFYTSRQPGEAIISAMVNGELMDGVAVIRVLAVPR